MFKYLTLRKQIQELKIDKRALISTIDKNNAIYHQQVRSRKESYKKLQQQYDLLLEKYCKLLKMEEVREALSSKDINKGDNPMTKEQMLRALAQRAIEGGDKVLNSFTQEGETTAGWYTVSNGIAILGSYGTSKIYSLNDLVLNQPFMQAVLGEKRVCFVDFLDNEELGCPYLDQASYAKEIDCPECRLLLPAWKHHAFHAASLLLEGQDCIEYLYKEMKG